MSLDCLLGRRGAPGLRAPLRAAASGPGGCARGGGPAPRGPASVTLRRGLAGLRLLR